jgi:hypothetical protein
MTFLIWTFLIDSIRSFRTCSTTSFASRSSSSVATVGNAGQADPMRIPVMNTRTPPRTT